MEDAVVEEPSVLETESEVPSSGWRARSDAWEMLFFALKQLITQPDAPTADSLRAEINRRLGLLHALELYWARPRRSVVSEIRELIIAERYEAALTIVEPIANHMTVISIGQGAEGVEGAEESRESVAWRDQRPAFEVLFVDDIPHADRIAFKADMAAHRSREDQFIYDLTIVPSFEDALIALILNPQIQAVVLRPGFTNHSQENLSRDLRQYLNQLGIDDLDSLWRRRVGRETSPPRTWKPQRCRKVWRPARPRA